MTGLILAEMRRVVRRRLTWFLMVGVILMTALTAFGVHSSLKDMPDPQTSYHQALTDWNANHVQEEKDCRANPPTDPSQGTPSAAEIDDMCSLPKPTEADFGQDTPADAVHDAQTQLILLLIFVFALWGASLVCAEFSSGAITTWLTFEPRRGRVFATKAVAIAATGLVLGTAAVALNAVVLPLVAHADGWDAYLHGAKWAGVSHSWWRLAVIPVWAALLGSALGYVFRHTVAVVGAALGWVIAVELVLGEDWHALVRWIGRSNLPAFVFHGYTFETDRCVDDGGGNWNCASAMHHVNFTHGVIFVVVVGVVTTLVGWWSFTRRDIN